MQDQKTLLYYFITVFLGIIIGYCLAGVRNRLKNKIKIISANKPQVLPALTQAESTLERKLIAEERLAIIERLSETVSSSLNLYELTSEIVRTTALILNVEICVLLLLDNNTDTLSVIASIGIEKKISDEVRIKKGEEISGMVAKFNDAKIINDLEKQASMYKLHYDKCYKNTLASIPLSIKNKVTGVLNVSNRKTGKPFSSADIEFLRIIAQESAVALQNFNLIKEIQQNYLNTIIALASALDTRDPDTYWHSKNVTEYAMRIAQELKLPGRSIEDIRYAGLLHDLGKIGIKDQTLMKPGKLTEEEYLQIKMHPLKGEEIIKSLPFLEHIAKIIRHHHERMDGKGYPDGIRGENIELEARILAVADSFDAMTSKRPYRNQLSLEEAKNELIKNANLQFDPKIVECFLKILERKPDSASGINFSV